MREVLVLVSMISCAMGLGVATLVVLGVPRDDSSEFRALAFAAGLGLLAVALGLLGLVGKLTWAPLVMAASGIASWCWLITQWRSVVSAPSGMPRLGSVLVALTLATACLGAIAPVTESDSLSYPIPIAQHLAQTGGWQFWPAFARSAYPLSQEFLSAVMIMAGNDRVGLLSAIELIGSAVLILLLVRRVLPSRDAGTLAVCSALGCPAAAFLAASAKEDLLLVMMTVAAALSLYLRPSLGAAAAAGLFAGLAAGAKYTGVPIGLVTIGLVPWCCGREQRLKSVLLAAVCAIGAGGLWYAVNIARFGNPVPPAFASLGRFPASSETSAEWLGGFGSGRTVADAMLTPVRMAADAFRPGNFGGRGNWINPLMWLGLVWSVSSRRRRTVFLPLVVLSLGLYVTWFAGSQIARLLLPAAALLSVPAADALLVIRARFPVSRYAVAPVLVASIGIVAAVGLLRVGRYVVNPSGFVSATTENFASINWMNTHLNARRDRVASWVRPSAYLRVPWMYVASDYQVEIAPEEFGDATRLRTALKQRGFTHVFVEAGEETGLEPWLEKVHDDPDSLMGGRTLFREPPRVHVTVFALR